MACYKDKNKVEESSIDKLLSNSSIKSAIDKIARLSKTMKPDDQKDLAVKLAKLPLSKSASHQKIKTLSKKSKTWDEAKESEPKKEKEEPIQSYEKQFLDNQNFKLYLSKLKTIASADERAASVKRLLDKMPKQTDKYKQSLKNAFLEAKKNNNLKESEDFQDESVAYEDDGWNEKFFGEVGLLGILDQSQRMMYEIQKARRGSYGQFGDTVNDLIVALEDMSEEYKRVASEIESSIEADWRNK